MPQSLARALVFVSSAAVLILEILAGRLLAPYLGVSLEVFTGIIGVVLAGISVGAWLGGRAADRGEPSRLIGPLLVAGGLTAMASPLLVDLIGPSARPGSGSIVAMTTFAFFAPAAVLSAVPPAVVKIRLASLAQTGSVVGSYSAVGTAGAIFGTFFTGFVLIAAFPTRPIVLGLGLVLLAGGMAIWATRSAWAVALVIAAGITLSVLLVVGDGPCQYETTYHCVEVVLDQDRPSGRLLLLDRERNSYVDLADPTHIEFRYLRVIADVVAVEMPEGPLATLSIGGGGFTFPRYLHAVRPGTENTVLEIDGGLVEIGMNDLGLKDEALIVVDDARRSIEDIPASTMDLAVGDAFTGLTVPWHLTTVEFVTEVERRLAPHGIYAINVIDRMGADFARAETASLLQVFDHVAVFAPPDFFTGSSGGNYVLAGSASPIDVAAVEGAIAARGGVEVGLSEGELLTWVDGAAPLVDDFAPVDQMIMRNR